MSQSGGSAARLALLDACRHLREQLSQLQRATAAGALTSVDAHTMVRSPLSCSSVDLQGVLADLALYPQVRFQSPRSERMVLALGQRHILQNHGPASPASCLEQAARARNTHGGRVWFALRFVAQSEPANPTTGWLPFGAGLAFWPRVELEFTSSSGEILLHLAGPQHAEFEKCENAVALLECAAQKAVTETPSTSAAPPAIRPARSSHEARVQAEHSRYVQTVEAALTRMHADAGTTLQKVVVARRDWLTYSGNAAQLQTAIMKLESRDGPGASYFFALSPGQCFFGRTPELLFAYHDKSLSTEAIAGTRPRGNTEAEDAALEVELCSSAKESQEHQLVRDHILDVLEETGFVLRTAEDVEVRRLSRVMHLVTPIHAALSGPSKMPTQETNTGQGAASARETPNVESRLGQLLAQLHPTPALAGTPRNDALAFLRAHEGFDRGLYAGPCGYLDENRGEIWIALRGGLLCEGEITLFAGAGIVPGSAPQAEWQETEAKLSALRDALQEAR